MHHILFYLGDYTLVKAIQNTIKHEGILHTKHIYSQKYKDKKRREAYLDIMHNLQCAYM